MKKKIPLYLKISFVVYLPVFKHNTASYELNINKESYLKERGSHEEYDAVIPFQIINNSGGNRDTHTIFKELKSFVLFRWSLLGWQNKVCRNVWLCPLLSCHAHRLRHTHSSRFFWERKYVKISNILYIQLSSGKSSLVSQTSKSYWLQVLSYL